MIRKNPLRRSVAAIAGGVLVATAAGCSSDPPDPGPVASELIAALGSGDFSAVPLGNSSPEEATAAFEAMTAGVGDVMRRIDLVGIAETDDENTREVTLGIGWDFDAPSGPGKAPTETTSPSPGATPDASSAPNTPDWTYQTTATLRVAEDTEAGWTVDWSPSVLHPQLTEGATLNVSRTQAQRADILGAGGAVIVTERPVYRVGIDKTRVDAALAPDSATALAEIVGVDPAGLAERVQGAGERAFVEAITLREADGAPLLDQIAAIEGAVAIEDTLALAPTREFARPVLGTVGEATAELVEESGGRIEPGDVVGLSGLQQQYDQQLGGTPGLTVELVPPEPSADATADPGASPSAETETEEPEPAEPEVLFEREAVAGTPLTTTLNVDLQTRAEGILADVGPASAIVAVQPSTGAVLAAASGPGGEGYSTATLGQYAPGSTFKVVTSLALLRAGLTADSVVECTPAATVDGRAFENYSDYPSGAIGEITLRQAVANSCNTAFINQNSVADQASLAQAAASLGLGAEHATGAPAFLGSVPAEADGTAHAASMIGQGEVLASPLAMATVAASVAAGHTVAPTMVDPAGAAPESTLTADEAAVLQDLMRAVVTEGSGEFLGDVPGDPVGAKTGTAEYGTESPPRTHAWMIATQGDLAVAVFVEDGESGSRTAGPLLEAFLGG